MPLAPPCSVSPPLAPACGAASRTQTSHSPRAWPSPCPPADLPGWSRSSHAAHASAGAEVEAAAEEVAKEEAEVEVEVEAEVEVVEVEEVRRRSASL